ncbi:MAG: hypothetical protein LUG13_00150 [Oscillospiraceae bacterium]|nr:hypothetical protein [Oscillospiraceae bacterium]
MGGLLVGCAIILSMFPVYADYEPTDAEQERAVETESMTESTEPTGADTAPDDNGAAETDEDNGPVTPDENVSEEADMVGDNATVEEPDVNDGKSVPEKNIATRMTLGLYNLLDSFRE